MGRRPISSSRCSRPGVLPRSFCEMREMQPELSGHVTDFHEMPSCAYSSCSAAKTCELKVACSRSLAKLISSCSSPLVANDSKPKMSRMPMNGAPAPPLSESSFELRNLTVH